jgi:radical SAM enzyme (TIGR01210 family)
MNSAPRFSDRQIVAARGPKNAVDPQRPYAFLVEDERSAAGAIEPVATLFLTNRECPLRCVYCDLWKNTTDDRVAAGDIPRQIDFALARLPPARHIKLYNSGNFFDPQAIPREDLPAIAERVRGFATVVVENHPIFCNEPCGAFRRLLDGELEVAMGLETVDPAILPRLNKRMTLDDFSRAAEFLRGRDIRLRAFILLKPPFCTDEADAVEWAVRSVEFAIDRGVRCCSIIPTRGDNGIMEQLACVGLYSPPKLRSLEAAMDACLRMSVVSRGTVRVLVDLWDIERLASCRRCVSQRVERLRQMNRLQQPLPEIACDCGEAA